VFRDLQEEFKDLVTSLITKAEPLLYVDIHSHLLTYEFLHKISLSSMGSAVINTPLLPTPNTPPAAFISHRQSPGNFGCSRRYFHRGWRPNQFNNRGHRFVASRPDLCSLPHSSNGDSGRQGNWQRNRGQNPRCQLCQTFCHTTSHYPQLQHRGYGPSANLALCNISLTGTAAWFLDTGANQHISLDLAGLAALEPYLGNDNLHVGDGKGLPISHIDCTKIYTPHRSFTFSNVLHVPAIRKRLLSVQKFCLDNNVYFEFHHFVFYVKDLHTNKVLL